MEAVSPGAQTPEELETLFEDAFVLRDERLLTGLFEPHAVLAAEGLEARGSGQIGRFAAALWRLEHVLLAQPRQILQARDTALVLADQATSVARRGGDGWWRYAISLLDVNDQRIERKHR